MEYCGDKTDGGAVRVNVLFGPPSDRADADRMLSRFFSEEGMHMICGGTTAGIAAAFLKKPLAASLDYEDEDIPPTAELEGADLVTEGVITVGRVLEYAKDLLGEKRLCETWQCQKDGASLLSRALFGEASDIHLYIGRAVNPAHETPGLPIGFDVKMQLAEELADCLEKMGKKTEITYF